VFAGGWALAQSPGHFGHPSMRGDTTETPGPGMTGHMNGRMGSGMMHQKGPGMGMMHQQGSGMGPGMRHQTGPGLTLTDPTQIEALKRELAITTAQEPAWNKYTKAIQDASATMQTTREGVDPNAVSKMTPQDRYAFVTKMREQGQKQFDTVKTAADELFATLDDAQKTKARDTLPGLASFGPGPIRGAFMRGPQHMHQDQ
jgi:hypothetical protein